MKLKIAVCDDDLQWSERIRQSISEYMCHVNQQCDIQVFESGEELCGAFHGSRSFDIVFLDPPYSKGHVQAALLLLPDIMTDSGVILCEHEHSDKLPEEAGAFVRTKEYRYGRISVSAYRKKESR